MLEKLAKIGSKVICVIDDKSYCYENGKEAYQQLLDNYSIKSIKALESQIITYLELKEDNQDWQEDYKEQFGNEPSFF